MSSVKRIGHDYESKLRTVDVASTCDADFKSLLLSKNVFKGLNAAGFRRPSPIQHQAIPLGILGLDLLIQAKSGTGKTCVFVVTALEMIMLSSKSIQVLIVAPTREIAVQIHDVFLTIGKYFKGLAMHTFIGGMPLNEDLLKLKLCHIAIGTPGRIKQLIEMKKLKTDSVRLFILDEADKLFDDAFQSDINWIYSSLPMSKQILTLSATYTHSLADFITNYMRSPTIVRLNFDDPALIGVCQYFTLTRSNNLPKKAFEAKVESLVKILQSVTFNQCLIFSNYQSRAESLCERLVSKGWPAAFICGNQDQKKRLSVITKLKNVQCRILISTDLTARGIDAENVDLIIHIDVPWDSETYLHRMGRAGRFGSLGISITIVNDGEESNLLSKLQTERNLKIYALPDDLHDLWNYKPLNHTLFNTLHKNGEACVTESEIAGKFSEAETEPSRKNSCLNGRDINSCSIPQNFDDCVKLSHKLIENPMQKLVLKTKNCTDFDDLHSLHAYLVKNKHDFISNYEYEYKTKLEEIKSQLSNLKIVHEDDICEKHQIDNLESDYEHEDDICEKHQIDNLESDYEHESGHFCEKYERPVKELASCAVNYETYRNWYTNTLFQAEYVRYEAYLNEMLN